MRLVCISDTHNDLDSVKIPDGDVLIHAGDLAMMGTPGETAAELIKLARLPHKTKILIAGNHDFLPERNPELFRALVQDAGVKALTYAQAAGLSLLATFAVTRIREPKEPSGAAYTLYVVNLLMMWGLGCAFYHIWCT